MKPRLPALVALCCLVTGCQLAIAARPAAAASPLADVAATSFLVENAATGEVLAARNADARVPIASITKLMTVLVTLEHHKLTDVVTVDSRAAAVGESVSSVKSRLHRARMAIREQLTRHYWDAP